MAPFLWEQGDQKLIDGILVNGTANSIGRLAGVMRQMQTGYLYTYAFAMIIGLAFCLAGWSGSDRSGKSANMSQHLLSILIWLPIFGGFALLAIGDAGDAKSARAGMMRNVALAISAVTFILSTGLYTGFDNAATGMQFVERMEWIASLGVHYYLGVDGISAPLILLTTFITPLVVIAGWDTIKARPAQYFAAFLILEGLMIGVFAALDGILFYVFWEAMLVPMFLIIGVWGGARSHLRHHEVLPVHVPRLGPDAGCVYLPVSADRQLRPVRLDGCAAQS